MNWYQIFYWITVADNVKSFLDFVSNLFTVFSVISSASFGLMWAYMLDTERERDNENVQASNKFWFVTLRKLWVWTITIACLTWALWALVPSKKDAMVIIAGGAIGNFLGSDSSSKAIPGELTKYVRSYLKKESDDLDIETKKEMGTATPKESFIDKAKNLTKEEILEQLKTDTTFK